jgi:hypothetical protein
MKKVLSQLYDIIGRDLYDNLTEYRSLFEKDEEDGSKY